MGIAYVTITTRSPLWKLPLILPKADWILSKMQFTFMETVDLSGAITIFLAVSLVSKSVLKIEPFPINSLYLSPDEMLSIPNLRASKDG